VSYFQSTPVEGSLLSRDAVVSIWSECFTRLRNQLLAIPDRTAAALATCRDQTEARRIVRGEIEEALKALAKKLI
jgi:hypothetical protein